MKAGVIGLGQMGRNIAANLDRAGLLAAAWDVLPDMRVRAALSSQVALLPPRDLACNVDAVVFVVPSSREIEACLAGPEGLLATERHGQVLLDLTTSRPADTTRLARLAAASGRAYLDGGMSGGASRAEQAASL